MTGKSYTVRALHCDHRASEEEIYATLERLTAPLKRSWEKLERAERVLIKFNMMKLPHKLDYCHGRRKELVDDAVCRAVLRLLRERTNAKLTAVDTCVYLRHKTVPRPFNYEHILAEFDCDFIDATLPPFAEFETPGGGCMFGRYNLHRCFAETDAVVSVAKMKNHAFMGVTLCAKNLFGLMPMLPPEGRTRSYYHHLVRLSYVLADLAMITRPCLNIIDGLTAQSVREWGGEPRITNALVAGDHVIATDACAAHLMGHDPTADWPTPPFRRDRNHLLIASQAGFGTVRLEEIDFDSELQPPLADFDSEQTDSPETVRSWLMTTCQQGLFYRDHRDEFVRRHAGKFIYLQDGEVVWEGHAEEAIHLRSRRQLSGARKNSALWLKYVDPDEGEQERYGVYETHQAANLAGV